jgi:hypothetical protein
MAIDAKEALEKAKKYFRELTGLDSSHVEAVAKMEDKWQIVLSYYENPPSFKNAILPPRKVYKEIMVDSNSGEAVSLKFIDVETMLEKHEKG